MPLDHTLDLDGRQTYRLTRIIQFPDFVKSANDSDLVPDDSNGDVHLYADMKRKMYPMHSPAATWMSAAFFLDQKDQYKTKEAEWIEDRLTTQAKLWKIGGAIKQLRDKIASFKAMPEEDQLPDEDFALVVDNGDGSKLRKYPIRNPLEMKKAAEFFMENRDKMAFDYRHMFADRILTKAAGLGVKLPYEEEISMTAGQGFCSAKEAAEAIFDRVMISKKPQAVGLQPVQIEMLKMAKLCCTKPSQMRNTDARIKLASVVDQFDRAFGLERHYGEGLPRPEEILFGITKQAAEELVRDNIETTTGNMYKLADIERLRVRQVRDYLGDDYAEAMTDDGIHLDVEKAATVVRTMPRDDAEMFDALCKEHGINAWGQTKAAHTVKMDMQYMKELAKNRT